MNGPARAGFGHDTTTDEVLALESWIAMVKRKVRRLALVLPAATVLAAALAAAPASQAGIVQYELAGDASTLFPTAGTVLHPGAVAGRATIEDPGNGTPILRELTLEMGYFQLVPCEAGCDGVPLTIHRVLSPAPDQEGAGSVGSSISWGALTGWTQSGTAFCDQTPECQGGCSCISFVGFEGTGPAGITGTSFDSDPWTFVGAGFDASSIEIVDLFGGALTESILWRGTRLAQIPALPLLALGALGAGVVALGVRVLRRRGGGDRAGASS